MANLYYYLDKRSLNKRGEAMLKIAFAHGRNVVYHALDIRVKPEEWNAEKAQITGRPDMKFLNIEMRKKFATLACNIERLQAREDYGELTAREMMDIAVRGSGGVERRSSLDYVLPVYNQWISLLGKGATIAIYKTSLRNLMEYCDDIDSLTFRDINMLWLQKYQNWLLKDRGMSVNGANVYLRNLRKVFNFAIVNQFTKARYPFKDINMATTVPDKGDIPYEKFLEWAAKPMPDSREFYRDLFMLSFFLCGMRPVDLLTVRKDQVHEGRLVYYPTKLNGKKKLSIKIEPEAAALIKKYEGKELLLNIMESRTDYKAFAKHWIAALRAIGDDTIVTRRGRGGRIYSVVKHIGILPQIEVYDARRCFGTYAYNICEIPIDVISQCMGHNNGLKVTNFYIKRDMARADKANRELIDRVTADIAEAKKNFE